MNIELKAQVECTDGHVGHVKGLILQPELEQVTHLIVKSHGMEYLVPLHLVGHTEPHLVTLNCSKAVLRQQQLFLETEYVHVPYDDFDLAGIGMLEIMPRYVERSYPITHHHVPDGEIDMTHGMPVFAKDGRVGRVSEIAVDPANGMINFVMLTEHHLLRERAVTIERWQVKAIDRDGIHLRLNKSEVEQLPWMPAQYSHA